MDISVLIVSFNTQELLKDCLSSLKISLANSKNEVFVVDNHSQDNSVEMVKNKFSWVKIIANQKNLGFSKANNLAIKKAKGRYILILNPDTKIMPDTISKMISFMETDPNMAVATCRVELPDGQLDRDCRRHFPTPWRAICHFLGLSKIFPGSKIFDQYYMGYLKNDEPHQIDSCAGSFMMVRREAIKKVGLFDEDFFFYGEDLDWCWRMKQAGYKIMYTPLTRIIHYKGAASGMKPISKHLTKATSQSKKRALLESVRAMRLFYEKHYEDKYPTIVNWLMYFGMLILEKIRLLSA